jgi:hypothetical protein
MSSWTETDYKIERLMELTIYYRIQGKYADELAAIAKEMVE